MSIDIYKEARDGCQARISKLLQEIHGVDPFSKEFERRIASLTYWIELKKKLD